MTTFNSAPILLRDPSTFLLSEEKTLEEPAATTYTDDVPQHLAPEQHQYEFPPRSHLQALSAQLDHGDEDVQSYFDESSFTSSFVSECISTDFNTQEEESFDHFLFTLEQEQHEHHHQQQQFCLSPPILVHDRQLSPLQLPVQLPTTRQHHRYASEDAAAANNDQFTCGRIREESYDSVSTITQPAAAAPCSFLSSTFNNNNNNNRAALPDRIEWHNSFDSASAQQHQQPMWQDDLFFDSVHPYQRGSHAHALPVIHQETEPMLSDNNSTDDDSSSCSSGSKVVLIKLNKKTKHKKIAMSPRVAYQQADFGFDDDDLALEEEAPIESASVFLPVHGQRQETRRDTYELLLGGANDEPEARAPAPAMPDYHQWQARVEQLEREVQEEKAMRKGFEKAMEEMVLLMDQQQKLLYDRLDQEIAMRKMYESRMHHALEQLQPLETKIQKETSARCELESMMSHVLNQVQDLKASHHAMERQLLKQQQASSASTKTTMLKKKPAVANKTTLHAPSNRSTTTTTTMSSTLSVKATTLSVKPATAKPANPIIAMADANKRETTTSLTKAPVPSRSQQQRTRRPQVIRMKTSRLNASANKR
ncbi:hypothetical protein BC940DRAFT_287165 [Gongronella butleri]|nr:hypothetical protein BC940DRAFT_287165 [Gongronella butleri]